MIKLGDFIKLEDGTRAKVIQYNKSYYQTTVQYVTDKKKSYTVHVDSLKMVKVLKKTKTLDRIFKSFADIEAIKIKDKYINGLSMHHGSDPEIFVIDGKTKEVIPSFAFLKSKSDPNIIENFKTAYGGKPLFWDGFQAEFNTHAETCFSWVADSIHSGLMTLDKLARKHNPNAKLTIQSTIDIPIDMLMEAKDEHVEFGCMPSFNAYGMEGLKLSGRDVPFRSAGGHIHFGLASFYGHKKLTKEVAEKYVKALDKILGVACVSLFAGYDDPRRRELYGLAGEYRTPNHGLEYRTLSNAWMAHPLIFNMVFELARKVVVLENIDLLTTWKTTEQETIECINKCDVKLARKILKRNEKMFKAILYSINKDRESAMYEIFMRGMDCIVDTSDILKNWNEGYASHCEGYGHNIRTMSGLPKYDSLVKAISVKLKSKTA